ncbi:orotidine-5'-phosphate decarboxylase [Granulicella pectinivorans]|uniref:orotidine-5'-phosphate decarboxylase n=1 Tax=Granulicella pectinivorans TaxID=474950 RepID=UPI000AAC25F3|nr:orotidine-5'-phosphate decarboxylase [Granulicella pectinivorans]
MTTIAPLKDDSALRHDLGDAPEEKLAVALDFQTAREALDLVDRLEGSCRWMKVGLELYCASGNALIETLRNRGLEVFLDLKLHDIPNTVAGAIRSVANVGAGLLTLHAGGGEAMLRAAAKAATENPSSPRLLAVTVLTSMDAVQMQGVGLDVTPAQQVLRLARLAGECGIEGLVCSSEETTSLRHELGRKPFLVVPGIRPSGSEAGDQKRIATPADAIARGASMLVVGRPITQSRSPGDTARAILAEIAGKG